jgi:hypothetical protein
MAQELFSDAIRDLDTHRYAVDPEDRAGRIPEFTAIDRLVRFVNGLDQAVDVSLDGTDDIDGTAFDDAVELMAGTSIAAGDVAEFEATSHHEPLRVNVTVSGTTAPTSGEFVTRAIVRHG